MIFPFISVGCNLEINTARTAAYLANVATTCPDGLQTAISMTCDCPPLLYTYDADGVPMLATYTTPQGDNVSWYDADVPESGQFLGFLIEEVTMNAVASRTVVTRISSSGGGALGALRNKERRLDFTVLMFACDEASMEYGFRYLTDALGSPGCDDACTLCDVEYRDSCAPVTQTPTLAESLDKGRWQLKRVGLVEGPTWDTNPIDSVACNVRRVRFSLVSEFPWKYKCAVTVCDAVALAGFPADGTDCVNWSDILCGTQEVACSVTEPRVIGETGMIIEIQAGSQPLQHIEIAIRPDKFGYEADEGSRPANYERVEPCDLIYIPAIPASSKLVYDTSEEKISVLMPGGAVYDGSAFIATQEGRPPTFPTLRCGTFAVSVSASECSVVGSPTVTVKTIHREI